MAKYSNQETLQIFKDVHGNKYNYSKSEFENVTDKIIIICPKHGEFVKVVRKHKSGVGCPKCSGRHRYSTDEIIEEFVKKHGNKYDYSLVDYKTAKTKVIIICKLHGEFSQKAIKHKNGSGCPKCSKVHRYTTKEIIQEFQKIHGQQYDYSKVVYKGAKNKVIINCSEHGEFLQSPSKHLNSLGCKKCSKTHRYTTDEIIEQFRLIHGEKYDYTKVQYIASSQKVTIICPKHGEFKQTPNHHTNGKGCKKCGAEKTADSRRKSSQEIIKQFTAVHGNKYDYSKLDYINSKFKVDIICSLHGSFFQLPSEHKSGSGCPKCSKVHRYTSKEIIKEFQKIHGLKYDYSKVDYKKSTGKVIIICSKHGEFLQTPSVHKMGGGCQRCSKKHRYTKEEIILNFRKTHKQKYDYSQVEYINTRKSVKIICPKHGVFHQRPSHHINGVGCPTCSLGWSKFKILEFLNSIDSQQILHLDSIELLTIINQGKLPDKLKALVFSQEQNRDSSIRALKEQLLIEEEQEELTDDFENEQIENENLKSSDLEQLNSIQPSDSKNLISLTNNFDDLHGLDHPIVDSCDKEAIEFLIQYKLRRFWNRILNNEIDIKVFKKEKGGKHFQNLKDSFLDEYKIVKKYKTPKGYSFPYDLNLMQKLTVFRIKKNKRYGNWSGTGAGKTVSFIISSREIDSRLTILIGLNSTMEQLGEDILDVFPDSKIYYNSKNYEAPEGFQFHYYKKGLKFDREQHNFLILNYDKFQQAYSEKLFQNLTSNNQIDFICIDEIHNVKQRTEEQESKRRATLKRLIGRVAEQNENLHVLGMSATPVINNLKEAKSLLELVTGKSYYDLSTTRTLNNAIEAFKHLTLNGLRYKPNYAIVLKELTGENTPSLKIDGTYVLDRLLKLGNTNYSKVEQILLELKLNAVKSLIKKGTVIYTYFTTGMVQQIKDHLTNQGYKVGTFTGKEGTTERKDSKKAFIEGNIDILIGSKPIGTGVNGFQYVCKRMIILSLPWTDSEYTQLKGRIYRQGSKFGEVEIVIPQVYIPLEDKEWSWDLQRLNLIRNKKTLADAAVDGVIPDRTLPSPKTLFKKSQEALKEWKERISQGDERIIQREDLKFPLHPEVLETLQRKLGDFSILNQKWSTSTSKKTHKRLQQNPEEWFLYHQLYSEKRKTWSEIPFKLISSWIKRKDFIVADLGCGQNLLKEEIKKNKVYSFDHYAIDESVIACDISSLPLEDDSVDISVLCLALMGSNSKDYLKEAYRIIRPMGYLFIAEPKKKQIDKIDELTQLLKEIGFGNIDVDIRENFIYWKCIT